MLDWIKGLEAVLSLIAMLFGGVAITIAWLTRGSKANAVKIHKLERTNENLSGRLSEMETRIANLPTKDDFHQLDLQLREMGGRIETVSTRLEGVDRVARRIDDHLLSNGGKQ